MLRNNRTKGLKCLIIVKHTPLFNIIIYLYNSKQLLIQLQASKNLTVQQVKKSFERCCSRLNRSRVKPKKTTTMCVTWRRDGDMNAHNGE